MGGGVVEINFAQPLFISSCSAWDMREGADGQGTAWRAQWPGGVQPDSAENGPVVKRREAELGRGPPPSPRALQDSPCPGAGAPGLCVLQHFLRRAGPPGQPLSWSRGSRTAPPGPPGQPLSWSICAPPLWPRSGPGLWRGQNRPEPRKHGSQSLPAVSFSGICPTRPRPNPLPIPIFPNIREGTQPTGFEHLGGGRGGGG